MDKLVRDKIPTIINNSPGRKYVEHRHPNSGEEAKKYLFDKLKEEVDEVLNSNEDFKLIEELADVYEVLRGICTYYGLKPDAFVKIADIKRKTNGSFDNLCILERVVELYKEDK